MRNSSISIFTTILRTTAKLLPVFAITGALTIAQQPSTTLPEAPEKATFVKVCSGCHKPEVVLGRLDTSKNWAKKVDSMVNRGAEATPDEITQINTYLNAHFAFVPSEVHLPEGPGKAELQKVCSSCHPAEIVVNRDNQNGLRKSWLTTIDRMSYRGAKGTPEEMELITGYLAANFGYIPVPSLLPEGPGKQTVERVCGPCHGVSFFIDRSSTRAGWRGRVTNMISRGAVATPAEVEEISDYLGRFLGPKAPPQ